MKAGNSTVRALCLLAGLLLCGPLQADKASEQKKLDALKGRIAELQKNLRASSQDHNQQSKALRESEVAAGKLRQQISASQHALSQLKAELKQLDKERQQLQRARQQQQEFIGQHINAAYRMGREEQIKLLLNEQDPARFNRLLKYHDYFLQARNDKIQGYLDTITKLEHVQADITKKQQQQLAQQQQLKQQQAGLKERIADRKVALAALSKTINSDKKQLSKLQRERAALEQVIAELERAIAELDLPGNSEPFAKRQGKLQWPVKGQLRKRFGNRRQADIRWNGWLLGARAGTPVNAIHHGRVVFSDYLRGHGLLIILDHGDGYMSLYAHNQVLLKETGEWVQSGEPISRVGSSGGLDNSALYFEIRKNSQPRNPAKWLKRS
ncbi:peptidoglycan DD-metalloendopeptidase family protein [Porticoccus sp. W117]|uniref:murein hydrolase activator EnvC family protein n=1 Tax=Porticoccus sp. W117 TaxID=3054777 RepID=UPI0025985E06|nr:peptidoglycan DD-metalloendopeptidase family protein [Porticoccus sp. W117]MDM3872076.1 peptidoglycan DD-metalloendopeptidase family protein [Porticoccus sp. W117]